MSQESTSPNPAKAAKEKRIKQLNALLSMQKGVKKVWTIDELSAFTGDKVNLQELSNAAEENDLVVRIIIRPESNE